MDDVSSTVVAQEPQPTDTSSPKENKTDFEEKNESGVVSDDPNASCDSKETETEVFEDAVSLGEIDSLPTGDEIGACAAGSDSGVEGCGRALSSGGGSRSCASSVVSCGSESSSVGTTRPRRRVSLAPPTPAPRPITAPRGPMLATRDRARSREKPTPPEKPRPLTPKPRIRPTTDLPNLVRESPALRAKPTKTSTARCKTPSSPSEEKKWPSIGPRLSAVTDSPAARLTADKYGTLPRRRRDNSDQETSPKHEPVPITPRRPTVTRSVSSRSTLRTRVRIYAEKFSQTVLLGSDIESALAGIVPNIDKVSEPTRCHRGVQASSRDAELARLTAASEHERARRLLADEQLAAERAASQTLQAAFEQHTQRLLSLAGAGADASTEGCLRALEEQLQSTRALADAQRVEIDKLRIHCDKLQVEAMSSRTSCESLQARLAESEREAREMQEFLSAEAAALTHELRDAEAALTKAHSQLDKRRTECRQLVRMCEQRRQEALLHATRARRAANTSSKGAMEALDSLASRMRSLATAVRQAYSLPNTQPTTFHNVMPSRSESGDGLSVESEATGLAGLAGAVGKALRATPAHGLSVEDDRSRASDENDCSADLLDSETEPCMLTDPDCVEDWWSNGEALDNATAAWSGEELSPSRESFLDGESPSASEHESLRNQESLRNLSAAITQRQRSEHEDERDSLLDKVVAVDNKLSELMRTIQNAAVVASKTNDVDAVHLAAVLKDKMELTERNIADVVVQKLAEIDVSKIMMDQFRNNVEAHSKQMAPTNEEEEFQLIEQELQMCSEADRRERYEALDGALAALAGQSRVVRSWPRLATMQTTLERLAFALATPPPPRDGVISNGTQAKPPPMHTAA